MANAVYRAKSTPARRTATVATPHDPWAFALLAACVIGGSLPLAVLGYGSNQDAARGIQAALALFHTGVYHSSRLPGNPLYEYLLTLIVPWAGVAGANLFSVMCYVGCVHAFWLLVRGSPHRIRLTAIFALTPVLLLNAVTAKDFVLGMALILYSFQCATQRRLGLACLLLGLAIGCRLTNTLFTLSLATYWALTGERLARLLPLIGLSLVIGLAFYAPIFAQHHLGMFILNPSKESLSASLLRTADQILALFGIAASAGFVAIAIRHRDAIRGRLDNAADPLLAAGVVTIMLFTLLFTLNSNQTGYLLNVVPFIYLLIAPVATTPELALLGVLVASYAVVNIDLKGGSSGARRLSLAIHRGLIAQEYQDRRDLERLRSGIDRCVPARRAVVLTGLGATLTLDNSALVPAQPRDMAPGIEDGGILEANNLHRLRTRPVFFVYALSASNIALLRAAHYALYYFPAFAPAIEIDQFNVDPYRSAMTALQTSGAHACFAIGGA